MFCSDRVDAKQLAGVEQFCGGRGPAPKKEGAPDAARSPPEWGSLRRVYVPQVRVERPRSRSGETWCARSPPGVDPPPSPPTRVLLFVRDIGKIHEHAIKKIGSFCPSFFSGVASCYTPTTRHDGACAAG